MLLGVFGPAQAVVLFLFVLIVAGGAITVFVLYLLNMQNLLKEIKPENRLVEPSNVWLMFIPLFNMIYPFILYPKVCDSVKKEYESRGHSETGDYGRSIGITMPILGLCGIIPLFGVLASIGNFVLLIVFWVKLAGFKNSLKTMIAVEGRAISNSTDILD